MALRPVQKFPVDPNVVGLRISLSAEFGDHRPVDLHVAGRNEFLRLPAGGNSGSGDDLLQAFHRHN